MTLPERVRQTSDRYRMFAAGQTVVVAVSGGPDSVALLHCLHSLRDVWPISLIAAHLDHGFRGSESAADAEYVRALCARLDIPCRTAYEDVPALKKRLHLSSQEAARRVRHAFLRTVAQEAGAERIALGHTRDDRAETILLNLLRGSGSEGLVGFPPVRLPLVRPLFEATRAETVAYCKLHDLEPRTDPSNASLEYGRNRVRHELLPYLAEHFNPRATDALLRMSDLVSADSEALAEIAAAMLVRVQHEELDGRIVLSVAALIGNHIALQRRIVRLAIARVRGGLRGIENETVDSVLESAARGEKIVLQLPRDDAPACQVSLTRDALTVARAAGDAEPTAWHVEIPAEGVIKLAGGAIQTQVFESAQAARAEWARATEAGRLQDPGRNALLLPLAGLRLPLAARSWRKGDRMRPRGLNGSRKLQDIFVDRKTPANRRLYVPVIVEAHAPAEAGHVGDKFAGPANDSAEKDPGGRILGLLGVQGAECSLSLTPSASEPEIIGACLLIMALSDTSVT